MSNDGRALELILYQVQIVWCLLIKRDVPIHSLLISYTFQIVLTVLVLYIIEVDFRRVHLWRLIWVDVNLKGLLVSVLALECFL